MPNSNFMSDANATAIFTAYATAIKLGLKAWIGTTAEWNQLTDVQKKQYQVNFKTDDCSEESIEIVKRSIANDFSTSVNYAVGDFCYHLGMLYKCITAHTAGAWDATHFSATQVGDEIGELKNTLTAKAVNFDPASGVTITSRSMYKCSNILLGTLWIVVPSTLISASSELGLFDVTIVNEFRTIGVATSSSIKGQIGHFRFTPSGKLCVDNNFALPGAGEYKLDITVALS